MVVVINKRIMLFMSKGKVVVVYTLTWRGHADEYLSKNFRNDVVNLRYCMA